MAEIDFDRIEKMMRDSPDDWYSPEESAARMEASLKKALNVTGPRVTTRDVKGPAGSNLYVLDIDFDDIVERNGLPRDKR